MPASPTHIYAYSTHFRELKLSALDVPRITAEDVFFIKWKQIPIYLPLFSNTNGKWGEACLMRGYNDVIAFDMILQNGVHLLVCLLYCLQRCVHGAMSHFQFYWRSRLIIFHFVVKRTMEFLLFVVSNWMNCSRYLFILCVICSWWDK